MIPYQIALLRYRHNAASGELVNVGVVLWVPTTRRVHFRINERYGRLASFFPGFDGPGYRQMVRQLRVRWEETAVDLASDAPSVCVPDSIAELLPLLMREDGSSFQWSTTMGGAVPDPVRRLDQLYAEWIERNESRGPRERRDEVDVWSAIEQKLRERGLTSKMSFGVELGGARYHYRFRAGWQNGKAQVIEPISLDILNPTEMIEKANTWSGRLYNLGRDGDFAFTGVVAAPQRADLKDAFERATAILQAAPRVRQIVTEAGLDQVLNDIEHDLALPHDNR